jgi:hypothetical protein
MAAAMHTRDDRLRVPGVLAVETSRTPTPRTGNDPTYRLINTRTPAARPRI